MSLDLESNIHQINLKVVKPFNCLVYEFEDFRLDAEHMMLYQGGKETAFTPKQVETLLALVEKRGEIVSKADLMERLWPKAFVEDSNLIQNIYVLRKSLGDTSAGKPMIETLHRRGYRFNAELKDNGNTQTEVVSVPKREETEVLLTFPAEIAETISGQKPGSLDSPDKKQTIRVLAAVFVLIGAIGSGYYLYLIKSAATAVGKKSLAVLPLKPINGANRDDLYEIGVAESLIQRLNMVSGLSVRQLNATRGYTEISQDPIAAGREQKVDYVLASNYQFADGKIKITFQLINVLTEHVEDSYGFENETSTVFATQTSVAIDVGNRIIARFDRVPIALAGRRGTSNEEAYRFYLQGMGLIEKSYVAGAVENFDRALKLDPNYALAWAGKALAHRGAVNLNRKANPTEEYQNSMAAIDKALSLDPNISDAYSALCENKFQYEYDFAEAERACRRSVELDPNSSTAHRAYSWLLNSRGRHDESIAEIKAAIDIEPASFFNQRMLAIALYLAGRYDESVTQYARVLELDDENGATYQWLIRALEMQGKEPEAFELYIRSLLLEKRDSETIQRFRDVYQTSGWRGVLVERLKTFGDDDTNSFRLACWNARVGNKDKAFEYLEKSYQRHSLMYLLQVEPQLDSLHDDPRFDDLVRRVGLNR